MKKVATARSIQGCKKNFKAVMNEGPEDMIFFKKSATGFAKHL